MTASGSSSTLDTNAVEEQIHRLVNQERSNYGHSPLNYDEELARIARGHSTDMVNREFTAHTCPDGNDFSDRYADAGYECRIPASERRFLQGAENIGKTYFQARVIDRGYHETVDDVAAGLVTGWMDSPGHRKNILNPNWQREGIGIATKDEDGRTAVYATQNFC